MLATRRFSTEEYHRMGETHVLGPDDRVELIEGEIVEMSPIGARHARCVDRLNRILVRAVGDRAIVRVQNPVRLSGRTEVQPDVALLAWRDDFYPETPGPANVLLVVEVADSSVVTDRRVKLPLYARSGIAEAWLVDLVADVVEVHRHPGPDGYGTVTHHPSGDHVAPEVLTDVVVDTADLLR